MRILALETSGEYCSVALLRDDDLFSQHEQAARRHGERLLPMMESVLTQGGLNLADLNAIAFGRGPGSFTGVRIAAAVAQGVAFGAQLPVVAISTLAGLAHAGWRRHQQGCILAAVDARIGEVYWGLYWVDGPGQVRPVCAERVSAPDTLGVSIANSAAVATPDFGVGNGWERYPDTLRTGVNLSDERIDARLVCTAADIAELAAVAFRRGESVAPELAHPVYIRDQVAIKPKTLAAASLVNGH